MVGAGMGPTEFVVGVGMGEDEVLGVGEEERADGTPRKVQKGQINALAKMLSALRR